MISGSSFACVTGDELLSRAFRVAPIVSHDVVSSRLALRSFVASPFAVIRFGGMGDTRYTSAVLIECGRAVTLFGL